MRSWKIGPGESVEGREGGGLHADQGEEEGRRERRGWVCGSR